MTYIYHKIQEKEGKQMKKKWMSLIVTVIMMLSLAGCGKNADLSSVSRNLADSDGTVWFDEEAVALAGSVRTEGMSEAETARAEELRTMATDALALLNAKRAENGLAALTWSNGLESCAMVRAQEAASKFSHTRPNGKDWYTVNSELMWGENLAKGYDSAQSVVDAWMASSTHAANILAGDFTTCSIAIYETKGKLYFAQEFGY